MKNTSLTALGGIISALSIFFLFLAGVIPNLTYVVPAFAALLLIVTLEEAEPKWSLFIFIAVSLLSFFIVTDKEADIMYLFVFGYYPIAKKIFESHFPKWLSWLFKFALFNIMMILGYLVIIYVFLIPVEGLAEFGKWTPLILLAAMNVCLVIYDYLIGSLTALYHKRFHKKVSKMMPRK